MSMNTSIAKTLEEFLKSKGIDATVVASDEDESESDGKVTVTKFTSYVCGDVRVAVETDTAGRVVNVEIGDVHGTPPTFFVGAEAQAFVTAMKHVMAKVYLQ